MGFELKGLDVDENLHPSQPFDAAVFYWVWQGQEIENRSNENFFNDKNRSEQGVAIVLLQNHYNIFFRSRGHFKIINFPAFSRDVCPCTHPLYATPLKGGV